MGEKLLTIFQANKKQKQTKFCKLGNIRKSKLLPRGRNIFIHSWKTDYASLTEQKVKMVTIHLT